MGKILGIPSPFAPLNVDREVRDILCPQRELRKLVEEKDSLSRKRRDVEDIIKKNNDMDRKWEGGLWWVLRGGVMEWVAEVTKLEGEIDSIMERSCTCCFPCSNYSLAEQIRNKQDAVTARLLEYQNGAWGNEGGIWRRDEHAPTAKEMEDAVELLLHLRERMEISAEASKPGKVRSKIYRKWLATVASVEVEWNKVKDNPDPNTMVELRARAMGLHTEGKEREKDGDHLLADLRQLLGEEYRELMNLRLSMQDKVMNQLEAFPSKEISSRVNLWLKQVEAAHMQVVGELKRKSKAEITTSEDHGNETVGSFRAEIARLLKDGEGLMSINGILVVTGPRETINDLPGSRADHPVGLNNNILKVFKYLHDDNPCIGIWGMGGVGKTTLVKEIIARLKSSHPPVQFDCVISVVVFKDQNIKRIQEDIGVQLGFVRDNNPKGECLPSNMDDRAKKLLEHLSKKTFLLILDGVWNKIDLATVGVPSLQDRNPKSKLVLTTRKEDVCLGMGCRKPIMLGPLKDSDSWDLFCHYISDAQELFESSEDFHSTALAIKNKCGGLPLAIMIVARAMCGSKDFWKWELAKSQLDRCFPGDLLPDQEDKLYKLLKYSFDNLPEERQRSCFLFCALYPENENIAIPEIVNYWIGEGLLDYSDLEDFGQLQLRGYKIIEDLKRACLLESGDGDDFVKMHNVVRDMAIWLGRGGGEYKGYKFFTQILSGQLLMVHKKRWDVDRVVLCNPDQAAVELVLAEEKMMIPPDSILLQTFILHGSKGRIKVPEHFFLLAANLRVLVLAISSFPLPMSLFELKSLRHLDLAWSSLSSIPVAISCLISLQFLNLSWNNIVQIPMELGKLTNLAVLDLKNNYLTTSILSSSISPLRKLQILDLKGIPCFKRKEEGALRIKDLRNLEGLRTVSLDLYNQMEDVYQLVHSNAVPANSISYLRIWEVNELTTDQLCSTASMHSGKMKQLQLIKCRGLGGTLRIDCFRSLAYLYFQELSLVAIEALTACRSLEVIHINFCPELEKFPSLLNFPNLKSLVIRRCEKLVGLGPMEEEEAPSHFSHQSENPSLPKLQDIALLLLTEMRSISSRCIYVPTLCHLNVYLCPRLKKLAIIPPDTNVQIKCPPDWWESLEWDRKGRFEPQFS